MKNKMNAGDLFIGMLCDSPQGTGVISWVDENNRYVYARGIPGDQHFKVKMEDIGFRLECLSRHVTVK